MLKKVNMYNLLIYKAYAKLNIEHDIYHYSLKYTKLLLLQLHIEADNYLKVHQKY